MRCHFLAFAALGLSTMALAQGSREIPGYQQLASVRPAAQQFQKLVLPGKTVSSGVRKLRKKLKWYKTLRDASREAEQSNKPILWIQALGKLSGYT